MIITPSQAILFLFQKIAFVSSQYQNATINNECFLKTLTELSNQLNTITFKTLLEILFIHASNFATAENFVDISLLELLSEMIYMTHKTPVSFFSKPYPLNNK